MKGQAGGGTIRKILDRLYTTAGALAAVCLMAILIIIVGQMVCRWLGIAFPGSTAYAGYFMASASFLAFAYALNADSHIRVSLLLHALGERRHFAEYWCFGIGTAATWWLAWYACKFVYLSWKLNEISQEQDMTPLWIPQIPMAFGAVLLAVCFLDNLITLVITRRHNIDGSRYTQMDV